MVSLQHRPWIGLLIALLYNAGLLILLFALVIDIATSFNVLRSMSIVLMSLLSSIVDPDEISASTQCFCGLPLSLGSLTSTFYFDAVASNGHLASSFALSSNSSI